MARLIERGAGVYENTGYAYTNTAFPSYLTAITDPRGITSVSYEYDSERRLSKKYDALGRYTSYIYDTAHHRQVATDRLNHTTTQEFTDAGQLASVQDANGGITSYTYDQQGNRIVKLILRITLSLTATIQTGI